MNLKNFSKWLKGVLLSLESLTVIVMDNAKYHSVEIDKILDSVNIKSDIIQ